MATLGIDIAKDKFDATLIDENEEIHYRQFNNDEKGFQKLQNWLDRRPTEQVHACMEATNVYWEDLAQFLQESGFSVSVVNPARIKGFAISQLRRNKNDKLDSLVIAQFCAAVNPKEWIPPTPEQRQLRALIRHSAALKKTLTAQKNRLATCRDERVRQSLLRIIEQLEAEIALLQQEIQQHIDTHPALAEQKELLITIKGIGEHTAALLMAEMYDLAEYDSARAAAADAGLTPSHHTSGSSVRRKVRVSKIGKTSVRGGLYWPAITAIRFNPIIKRFAERLAKKGKAKKVIITAVMRKLLHMAYGVLKNKTPFDPNYAPR